MVTCRIRNSMLTDDLGLNEQLQTYVKQGLQKTEILSFMPHDFPQYAWSTRTLQRKLQHFDIHQTDTTLTVEEVRAAVSKELKGPRHLLGYRAIPQDKART